LTRNRLNAAASLQFPLLPSLVIGGAVIYLLRTSENRGEPPATYVVTFTDAQLTSPEDRPKFIAALDEPNVVFRRDLGIKDTTGCDFKDLENYNLIGVTPKNCAQPNMGQQVTQRVGFNNVVNLKAALEFVK
jgi:hypothetical protein